MTACSRAIAPFVVLVRCPLAAVLCLAVVASWTAISSPAAAEEPLRVLLLDYHEPIEHDVLQSHLCVDRCTRERGCPDAWIRDGVAWFSDDLVVYRPRYLGQSARFVVEAYLDDDIDFVSLSGHHASGFSGERGRGRFETQELSRDLATLENSRDFFASPSLVMLQGCWTDVKSGFDGDPVEYVRHIIDDTQVRAGEAGRLQAAIQQIAGNEQAYRDLFPNACILGYAGTQVPGGLVEIYGQVHGFLRGLEAQTRAGTLRPSKFDIVGTRRTNDGLQQLAQRIDGECNGWPCNLCRRDPETYEPLAAGLRAFLRAERQRLHEAPAVRPARQALALERVFEDASLYRNASWSCSVAPPGTEPRYPEPIDRAPFIELFLDLLMVDFASVEPAARERLEAELVHLLGATTLAQDTRDLLLARLSTLDGAAWRETFLADELPRFSTFRQRDFFDFLAEIGCRDCFDQALDPTGSRIVRENAASQLRPSLGREPYEQALADPSARVRRLAASRLEPTLGRDLIDRAARDENEKVRETVAERFGVTMDSSTDHSTRPRLAGAS